MHPLASPGAVAIRSPRAPPGSSKFSGSTAQLMSPHLWARLAEMWAEEEFLRHAAGEIAAEAYEGPMQNVVANYTMSIHGQGLVESVFGLGTDPPEDALYVVLR